MLLDKTAGRLRSGPASELRRPGIAAAAWRAALALIWCVFLFVCTCTYNFDRFIGHGDIHFIRNPYPQWQELLDPFPSRLSRSWALQKIGHFTGFFVLAAILAFRLRQRWHAALAFAFSFGYAAATELLQLYFFRDGRLSDLIFDSAGILLAIWLCLRRRNGRLR